MARITITMALAVTFAHVTAAQAPGDWIKSMAPGVSQPFESVDLDARMLRFWDGKGSPIAIVQYRLNLHDAITSPDPAETVAMGLRLTGDGLQTKDSIWSQATGPVPDRPGDRFATGLAVLPLGPGRTSWYLTLGRVGGAPQRGAVAIQDPLPPGAIVVSDLALAGDESFDSWQFRGDTVPLSRSNVFDRKRLIHVYYQVRSDNNYSDVRTWITLTNVSDAAAGKRLPQLNYLGTLGAGVMLNERDLDMSKQKAGKYQLELQVGSTRGAGTSVRLTTFTLK